MKKVTLFIKKICKIALIFAFIRKIEIQLESCSFTM